MISSQYAAGLFDGEGWFSISRAKGSLYGARRPWAFQVHASLSIREKHIVEKMMERYGGTVTLRAARKDAHSDSWHWRTTGLKTKEFAIDTIPYLLAKKEQALLAVKFQEEKEKNGNQPVPDSRYGLYEKCWSDMKILNKKGVGKPGALTTQAFPVTLRAVKDAGYSIS